jgi:hypothetical protein
MLQTTHLQNVDLWEAWIEFDQIHPEYFGVLYVAGEVETKKKSGHLVSIVKEQKSALANTLVLYVSYEPCEEDGHLKEIIYSEPLFNISQYTSVVIYAKNEIIAVIKDIEVMV